MKKELEQQLIERYTNLFGMTGIKIPKKGHGEIWELGEETDLTEPIQYGITCGDGWYDLLNDLLRNIRRHIENDYLSQMHKHKYKFTQWLQIKLRSKNLIKAADFINNRAPKSKPKKIEFRITQIKSKFGGLRFYYNNGDETIRGMVQFAESFSWRVCEKCGTTKNIGATTQWIETICGDCWKKHPRFGERKWTKRTENFYMF